MNITNKHLDEIMKSFPYLCDWGLANRPLLKFHGYSLESLRKSLRDRVAEFRLCCEWISKCQPTKAPNCKISNSYGLKHLVEKWAGRYISNGVFIAAVLYCGLPYKAYDDSVNIYVGLSSRSQMLKA